MSLSLHLAMKVPVTLHLINGDNVPSEKCEWFELWETPTIITKKLLNDPSTLEAYEEWILSITEEETENIYDYETDPFNPAIIGTVLVHPGKEHIQELEEWIAMHKNWTIYWVAR